MKKSALVWISLSSCLLWSGCDKDTDSSSDDAGAQVTATNGMDMSAGGMEGGTSTAGEGMDTANPDTNGGGGGGDSMGGAEENGGGGDGETGSDPTPDVGGNEIPSCDPWEQDCPDGEKCVPYVSDINTQQWDKNRCVPVIGEGTPGDDCTLNIADWTDTCDASSLCWNLKPNDSGGVSGTCSAFCTGTLDAPMCEEGECTVANGGVINVCVEPCDPILQNCDDENTGCFYIMGSGFSCHETAVDPNSDGGKAGDACQGINQCLPGNQCVDKSSIPNCPEESLGCCTAFCATDESDPCPSLIPGTTCIPFSQFGITDPGTETIGFCAAAG